MAEERVVKMREVRSSSGVVFIVVGRVFCRLVLLCMGV